MTRTVKLMSLMVVVALAGAGCGKKDGAGGGSGGGGTGAPSAADCDTLGAKTAVESMAMTPPGTSDDQRRVLQAISDEAGRAIATRCKADGWSADAVACGLTAKNPGAECSAKLTAEQKQKMTTDVQAVFAKGAKLLGVPGGPPPPPAP